MVNLGVMGVGEIDGIRRGNEIDGIYNHDLDVSSGHHTLNLDLDLDLTWYLSLRSIKLY